MLLTKWLQQGFVPGPPPRARLIGIIDDSRQAVSTHLASCLLGLLISPEDPSETSSGNFFQTTHCHIPEESNVLYHEFHRLDYLGAFCLHPLHYLAIFFSSTLKMEALNSAEMLVATYKSTQYYNRKGNNLP
jgi:hypothetical protein